MKPHYLLFILFAILLQNNQASATKTTVNTLVSLTSTYTAARPGDTIVIANGSPRITPSYWPPCSPT